MGKIELPISTSYVPDWGVWEGVREIMQNGLDAEVEFSASLKVDWYKNTLRIENEGTTLPPKALLIGHSTKRSREDLIGEHGEGLVLGLLALLRAGHEVRIRNGSEVWVPALGFSKEYEETVLWIDRQKGRADKNRVRFEIPGISKDLWNDLKKRFLRLRKLKKDERVETVHV